MARSPSRTWLIAGVISVVAILATSSAGLTDGVDADAIGVTLESGIDVSSVRVDVSDAQNRALTIDLSRVSFSVRPIGEAKTQAVAAIVPTPISTLAPGESGANGYFNLQLALPALAPGPYVLSVTIGDGFAKTSGGAPVPIADAQAGLRSIDIYFPSVRAAAVGVGTRFVALGATKIAAVGQIWTVTHVDQHDGYSIVKLEHQGSGLLPKASFVSMTVDEANGEGYAPFAQLVDDPIADRLTHAYADKPLWTFGRYLFSCEDSKGESATAETRDRAPLRIKAVYRILAPATRRPLGTADPYFWCAGGCHQAYHVFTDEPLVVIFAPDDADIQIDPPRVISHPWMYRGPCVSAQGKFLDDWAFERVFSTDDPHTIDPEWPADFRDDLLAYRFVPGMTHRMVAWAAGYPSTFGTRTDLEALSTWEWYPGPTSTTAWFKDDAVQTFGASWAP